MSKERLDKIIYKAERTALLTRPPKPLVTIPDEDFEWLVEHVKEQAERVQELEELEQEYVDLNSDFTKLALENKRYREALEEIAQKKNDLCGYGRSIANSS